MKKIITLLLGLVLVLSCIGAYAGNDVAVEKLQEEGILVGDETGDLRLDDTLTRAEFSRLVWELGFIKEEENLKTFSDVPKNHWAYEFIGKMASVDLLCGYPDGTFRPDEPILLVHAERILLRVLNSSSMMDLTDFECGAISLEKNLLTGVTALQYEEITRRDAVHMIYQTKEEYLESESADQDDAGVLGVSSGGGSANLMMSMPTEDKTESSGAVSIGGSLGPMDIGYSAEEYAPIEESGFKDAIISPLSTFSIDTDTASYSNMRRFILSGKKPEKGVVRIEELINYFTYENKFPQDGTPFGITTEVGICPWNEEHLLARISIQGEELKQEERQPQNLVFLIDVSGSMYSSNKLPLVKKSIHLLLDQLDERDSVSIVTYASGTRIVLDGVSGTEKETIKEAIDQLSAGGGTAGSEGLLLAYHQAEKNLKEGNNRIILCTDGDFNIGVSSNAELKELVSEKREKGIFISVLGFGIGNYKDSRLEILADNGNGNYFYIDNLKEAKKVLADEMIKTLYTIAKDVKIQAEFNPATVAQYRLVGYENRMLSTEDFENDQKDAGELGAGSTVTVLYEIVPGTGKASDLRYQTSEIIGSNELFCVNIRYKEPEGTESKLLQFPVTEITAQVSDDFSFAAAVAEFGMIINESEYSGLASYDSVLSLAKNARGEDEFGYRSEFVSLIDLLRMIDDE
ncbi:MAG: DUF3520 domain-containing protein [Ruminococcaceae bacterium]|nr:DUF3520 domain-containing protein [Oscillospiraceae bacterium]